MGISGSKRVKTSLSNSSEFNSACDAAYEESLSLSQHAFAGVRPYQLVSAADHIHRNLSSIQFPLITKWVPSPPSQSQVDSALRVTAKKEEEEDVLGPEEFNKWAVEAFGEAVVGSARKAIASRIPLGVLGIAGLGAVTRSSQNLIGGVIGLYAIGVATVGTQKICSYK